MTENIGNNSNSVTVKTLDDFLDNMKRNLELLNQGKLKLPEQDYPETGLDMDVPAEVYLEMLKKEEERQQNKGK